MDQSVQRAVGAVGDQFYVTHCTTADSKLNNPGYTVRAASSDDRDALDAAFRYPPYELPIDMWRDLPAVSAAPRRLARTVRPEGGVWAVHSAYLATDTVGRDRSYFSHLLLLNTADPAAVLESWGAGEWVTSYPQGATKERDRRALPVGTLVGEAALTAFLGNHPPAPTELSLAVCPPRLRGNTKERRDLLARVLQAMLLLAAQEDEHRRRLYIHAEPGLVAMLLYGAARLLPRTVIDNLTFTTYEPYHRNIRDYKLAEVVGTYLGQPENGKGLDPDLGTTRGIALDTIVPASSSPELRIPLAESLPAGVNELIDLAVRGKWKLVPGVLRDLGPDPSGLHMAGRVIARAEGLNRVDAGVATIEELLAIQNDPQGASELQKRADKVWKVVKPAALDPRRTDVRTAFRVLIADRVKELWKEASSAIRKAKFSTWDSLWTVIRKAVGDKESQNLLKELVSDEEKEAELLELPTPVRNKMRDACVEVALLPPRPLLVPVGLGELDPLLGAVPDWAGYTAFVLLAKPELGWIKHVLVAADRKEMRKRAYAFLLTAPPAALAAYVHAARSYLDTDAYFLEVLFQKFTPSTAKLMDTLLEAKILEPSDWMKLCTAVGMTLNDWGEYLLEKERLAQLLVGLGGDGVGKDVWQGYLNSLTPALVSPDLIEVEEGDDPQVIHEWERKVHGHLRTARERLIAAGVKLVQALPPGGVQKLFAADNLLKWAKTPAYAESDGPEEVKLACERFTIDPISLVEVAYRVGKYDRYDPETQAQQFAPLLALFKVCFPVDHNWNTASRATREAIRLSLQSPPTTQAAFQVLLLYACVWEGHYPALHTDATIKLHPKAVGWLSGQVIGPAKKTASKAPPSPFEVVDEQFAEEIADSESEQGDDDFNVDPTVKGKTGKRTSRGASRTKKEAEEPATGRRPRRKSDSKMGMWLIVGAIVVVLALVVGVVIKYANKPAEPKPDPAKESPKQKDKGK